MSLRKSIFTSIPVLLLAACAPEASEGAVDVGATSQGVICGGQSWQDVEAYNGTLGADRTSVEFVKRHEGPVGIIRFNATFPALYPAPANPGTNNPGDAWCTGTLISRNLFITAGHCFDPDASFPVDATGSQLTGLQVAASDMEVAFNFQNDPAGNARPGVPFDIVAVHEHRLGGHDYAIIELAGNPGDTYGWTRVAAVTPLRGDDLTIIQHPNGLPKVIDSGTVFSTHVNYPGELQYDDLDTVGGTSGAGVLDWQGRLIAVHRGVAGGGCTPGVAGNRAGLIEAILPSSPLLGTLVREAGDHSEVLAAGDFNLDGFNDVVMGTPTRSVGTAYGAGAVRIIYSDANGPDIATEQWIHQDSPDVDGIAEGGDFFGASLAVGFFNADAFPDLAVGAPGENLFGTAAAGGVWVFYGSRTGLSGTGSASFDQFDPLLVGETAEVDDRMGSALAAGDFNKDGLSDLAVGTPGETVGANAGSGSVMVLFGSNAGLTMTGYQLWDQNAAVAANEAEANDRFGAALASGDFDRDGYKDLAIGIPYEDLSAPAIPDAGSISVLYGSATKLTKRLNNRLYQGTAGLLEGLLERGDRFGLSMAAGDINGDGTSDLIVGAPGEDIGTAMHAGFIHAVYGTANTGLTGNADVGISQDTASVPGLAIAEDRMGMSVSVAQLNAFSAASKAEDVLVGVPGENVGSATNTGTVIELFGRQAAPINGTGSLAFTQDTANVFGVCETGDRLGAVVLAKDLNSDGFAEAILSPIGEDVNIPPVAAPQSIQLLFGSSTGVTTVGNQFFP